MIAFAGDGIFDVPAVGDGVLDVPVDISISRSMCMIRCKWLGMMT